MTDIESLRQRDNAFSIEEKLWCCVWVHDRNIYGKSYDDIQRDFEARFDKKAPKHDLLIMWERNAFTSGSVNFGDNFPLISNGATGSNSIGSSGSTASGPRVRVSESPPNHYGDSGTPPRSYSNSNSGNSSPNNYTLRPSTGGSHHYPQAALRRTRPGSHDHDTPHMPSSFPKNFNPALYKTELCRQYGESGRCDYGAKCLFAHGKHELKAVPHYRTKVCTSFTTFGSCQFGESCMFQHPVRSNRNSHRSSSFVGVRGSPYHRSK
ncbi:hypothetical protein TYRP_017782 [Tyrophagus putrescentiae]|nr:hypothetical protein TYRP_017782 [Tyrophagus putrescentiae]